eukprot:jgi/Mesvir1/4376/Mv19755-RA.1
MRAMTSEYIEIDDAMKRATKELLPLRKRRTNLEGTIIDSMVSAGVDACNISGTQDRLVVKRTRKKPTVKKADYLQRLTAFFEGDIGRAQDCWDFINDLGGDVVEVNRLKRQKKKADNTQQEAQEDPPEEGEVRDDVDENAGDD